MKGKRNDASPPHTQLQEQHLAQTPPLTMPVQSKKLIESEKMTCSLGRRGPIKEYIPHCETKKFDLVCMEGKRVIGYRRRA